MRPPAQGQRTGAAVAALSVAVVTAVIYGLREVMPVLSTGVLYLLPVLLISTYWGLRLAVVTALASAAAFNWFHIPPTGRFTIADPENWVALLVYFVAALVTSTLAHSARARAEEAEARRREADITARLAVSILSGTSAAERLTEAADLIASALGMSGAELRLGWVDSDLERIAVPLVESGRRVGTLLVPRATPKADLERVRERLVPALAALVAAAIRREQLEEQLVETRALRRSDDMKTALLRAVSHDLRSPITAIRAAGSGLGSRTLEDGERDELIAVIRSESERLGRLVENLLELSRLEAGSAPAQPDWCALDELVESAVGTLGDPPGDVRLELEPGLPLVHADAMQIERAIANLVDNAVRHSNGKPVRVSTVRDGAFVEVRVADSGPGIDPDDRERIFEPFFRASGGGGAGLGLAIARGFVEANGGRIRVDACEGRGARFTIRLPVASRDPGRGARPARAGSAA